MSVHDRKNLKSALESAILYLQKQGVEEARQDAWLLLEHVCGISHSTYFVHSEDEMPKEQQEQYEALVRKRGEHIPLQQLTGEAWFYGIPFFVNEHVLIPRQDTEILVEEALRGASKRCTDSRSLHRFGMHSHIASCDERGLHWNRRGSLRESLTGCGKERRTGGRTGIVRKEQLI